MVTYVVPPGELVCRRVGLDGAREVDVVALFQVLRVHHPPQGELHRGSNCRKRNTPLGGTINTQIEGLKLILKWLIRN